MTETDIERGKNGLMLNKVFDDGESLRAHDLLGDRIRRAMNDYTLQSETQAYIV
jgi:hypothetical protein